MSTASTDRIYEPGTYICDITLGNANEVHPTRRFEIALDRPTTHDDICAYMVSQLAADQHGDSPGLIRLDLIPRA